MNLLLKKKLKELHRLQSEIERLSIVRNQLKNEVSELIQSEQQIGRGYQIGNHYICYQKKQVTGGITQAYLAQSLYDYYGGSPEAQDLFRYLMENRPVTEKYQLDVLKKNPRSI